MSHLRVAVDIGGTFTDVCVFNERTGEIEVVKLPSTPDPVDAVMEGVGRANLALEEVALFSHGTTVATNALITRRFGRAAMVTTRGFRDVIEIRRGTKDDLWDTYHDVAPPYIRRRDRLEVTERTDVTGAEVTPLNEAEARRVASILRRREVTAVAVCFINAYANPAHEERMRDVLVEELPGVFVCTSSEVLPEIFEHERFSTTVANAVVAPLVSKYVAGLELRLHEGGYRGDLLLLHSGGGVMTPRGVAKLPVRLASSGLAAGAIACRHLAGLASFDNAIGLDMGGTSTDICVVAGGALRTTSEWSVEYGYPICLPSIEVLTIGAGGGSIARIDEAGSLRNGPQSAGAVPGPAAYARGGELVTNTDANVVLGRLGAGLAGGDLRLDPELAAKALREQVGEPLGLSEVEAAEAVVAVADANMADAVRLVSVQRGHDPRDFTLVAFGGAGPLHGAAVAAELRIPTVLVPPNPGVSSALGCLLVDIRHDLSTMYLVDSAAADVRHIESTFQDLEQQARGRLETEGVEAAQMRLERTIDMRYRGQWRSLGVPVSGQLSTVDEVVGTFHAEHKRQFTFRRDEAPVEIYRLTVLAVGATPKPQLPRRPVTRRTASPAHHRPVAFAGRLEDVPIYDRRSLEAGSEMSGPAIIEQLDSTTVVPPGAHARVDEWLNVIIELDA